tara:strand:- start:244 stop:432 length:189 start_codon:yes stop_codon:yes gene_type:complete
MSEKYVKGKAEIDGLWRIYEAPNSEHSHHLPVDGQFETEQEADRILALWNAGDRVKGVYYGN